MSQLAFEGMPDRLYAASPARLATYLDCPRRYRLSYLDRPAPARGGAWARTSVGASVHTALARWWGLPRSRRTPAAGAALLDAAWLTDGFRDPSQSDRVRARSRGQVRRYLADVDPDHEPVAVERTVAVRTRRASLWGRVDRIDDRGSEGLTVVDYKTGRTPPSVEDAGSSLALAVYAAAAARSLRRACTRVELHHLPSGTVAGWDHTAASLDRHLVAADALADELATLDERHSGDPEEDDELFPARVASRCGWCDVRSSCRPGQAVPRRQSWAGVED
jgi:RecB family exonuclease